MFSPDCLRPSALCRVLLLAVAGAPAASSAARGAETAAPAAPQDHVLFMGLDVTVPGKHGSGPIIGVSHGSAQVVVDGEIQNVTIRELGDVRTARTPKVSGTVLTLSEPKGVRTHSPSTSPGREVIQQQLDLAFIQDMRMAQAESAEKAAALAVAPVSSGGNGPPLGQAQMEEARAGAAQKMNETQVALRSEGFDPGGVANRASASGAVDLYDAYAVTFTAAAPAPIEDAFTVLIMQVRSPTTPNVPLQTVMFHELPKLTPEPRKIAIEQRGLPEGFAVDRVAVHIYAHGRELATNLSQQRVAVTRDEAHQFLVIRYVLEHKHTNLPATPVPDFLPTDIADHVPASEFGRSIDLHVDRDGRVDDVKLDATLAPGVTRYIENLVRSACFYPALQNGEPVAGPTTLALAEFVRSSAPASIAANN